jgi:8-oxo-dGTP pyrophosphatase MutT (NUDIX family)
MDPAADPAVDPAADPATDPVRGLPPDLAGRAREFAASGSAPVPPRDAATVVLLRRGDARPGGLEVYLLRRHVGMAFAAGMCVFPGGGVDPRDFDADIGWVGPDAAQWGQVLRTGEQLARALVCAAVRETFEESGVLLAGSGAAEVVDDTSGEDWERDRRALESRDLAFSAFLERRGLGLRTDLLRLWGSWVTPVFEPRRFDARFFVAELPAGQLTRDVSTESDQVLWLPVRDALRAVDEGRMLMLPRRTAPAWRSTTSPRLQRCWRRRRSATLTRCSRRRCSTTASRGCGCPTGWCGCTATSPPGCGRDRSGAGVGRGRLR